MDAENDEPRLLRRSTRRSSNKALTYEPTPRGPLKRTKKTPASKAKVASTITTTATAAPVTVNGSGEKENGSEEGESPSKKRRLEEEGDVSDGEGEMEVQESAEDVKNSKDQCSKTEKRKTTHITPLYHQSPSKKRRQEEEGDASDGEGEMEVQESAEDVRNSKDPRSKTEKQQTSNFTQLYRADAAGDLNYPRVLTERCQPHAIAGDAGATEAKTGKPSSKKSTVSTGTVERVREQVNWYDVPIPKVSAAENRKTMGPRGRATGAHRQPDKFIYHGSIPISTQEKATVHKEQVKKHRTVETASVSGHSQKGCMWYFCRLVLLMLLGSASLLAYMKIHASQGVTGHLRRTVRPDVFSDHFSRLEAKFPNQRPDLWKRSKIHLEKHLRTANPTEPVSLIITAGRRAERTLHCVAQSLASAFSSALDGSVVHIDGASKAGQSSDAVKLDIDDRLKKAFEGDEPVAVIHRFEELPPGSTLIFYRYCDHESAAYKRAFLLFTVLLPQDAISGEQGLTDVEEMVQDYIKERLVGSSSQSSFNEMDTDKFGGLWSRISHLTLPVALEEEVEKRGC